jgi:hypothetical protein
MKSLKESVFYFLVFVGMTYSCVSMSYSDDAGLEHRVAKLESEMQRVKQYALAHGIPI